MVVAGGYRVVSGGGGVAGGGAVVGGGGGGLMGMCYEQYQDGATEAITYAGAGRGDIESKLVTVGPGQGSYQQVKTPTYSWRPRVGMICCCGSFGLLLILLPFLFMYWCEVSAFFTGTNSCRGASDPCENSCGTLMLAGMEMNRGFCCESCPAMVMQVGLQCAPQAPPKVHDVVRRHYSTVYHTIPENHYVKVQMPQQPPLIHTVKVMTPPKTYDCASELGDQPSPGWSSQHVRWCCYRYKEFCPKTVVDKDIYHTVTKVSPVRVPVPEPMPTHAPIVHTIHHTYHVPSPPDYVHVHVPGPTVVKPVVVHDRVPVPVHEPPQVINVKKPYPVHIKGPDHYVKVPVPSPPHVVTQYHTQWNTVVDQTYDCHNGLEDWGHLWSHSKKTWCCSHENRGCGHWEKVVHVVQTYDCNAGFKNWYHGWSGPKKSWCCSHEQRGCPGDFHGHWQHHIKVHVEQHGVGHGGYDCGAGASNWIQGWSAKKKDFCCHTKGLNQYCVAFHCHGEHGNVASWGSDQRDFCCRTFQLGCPHTTLSPLGCDAPCLINGQSRTCAQRIEWTQKNTFGSSSNGCNLAYSKVQVECDVCRACSVEAAGCGAQGKGREPFDCYAALGNFCRAWSPAKKVWCCNNKQKGCQSPDTPPACDAGAGKVWKKVMISGHWSWEAVMAGGAVSVGHAYNCQAGLSNWQAGWSGDKKSWCCSHQQIGCPGYVYHGANAEKHVVVTHKYVAGGAGGAGAAGGSMSGGHSWSSSSGHSWSSSSGHHVVVHHYH